MKFKKNANCLIILFLVLLILLNLNFGTRIIEGHSSPLQILQELKEQNLNKIKQELNKNTTEFSMSTNLNKLNKSFRYQEIINMAIKSLDNSTNPNISNEPNEYINDSQLTADASEADGSNMDMQMTLAPYDEAYD